jgi:glycosyltransferase involved in cell wall biosynthesis
MTSITGTIITYNEEDHIEACIASLRRVCAEVVVVDSVSTDRTVELATAAGARVVAQPYAGEGPQRRRTEHEASHDWILALDADERLDDELVAAIQKVDLSEPAKAYAMNRKTHVGPHWIRGPGFYPDFLTRLYHRQHASYADKPGHSGVIARRVRRIDGHILHYSYDNVADWIAKINWMTSRDAQGLYKAGKQPSAWRPATSALASFFRQLFFRGGILRGSDGVMVTLTSVFRTFMKYQKLNELHERARRGGGETDLQLGSPLDSGRK